MKKLLSVLALSALALSLFLAFAPTARAPTVSTQLGLCLDESGSIQSSDWTIATKGVADAVRRNLRHDGSVELTVVTFGDIASIRLWPTVVTEANYESIALFIEGMTQAGGQTAMADGLYLTWLHMKDSANFAIAAKQVINVATDGDPNVELSYDPPYSWGIRIPDPETDVTYVRDNAALEGLDEIDAEAIGELEFQPDLNWMRDYLVYPQPGTYPPPPYTPGWVEWVQTWTEFTEAIGEKFSRVVLYPPALIYIDPPTKTAVVSEVFTVDINIADVFDLIGWQTGLYFDRSVVECVAIEENPIWTDYDCSGPGIQNDYSPTHGRILTMCVSLAEAFNGDATLFTATFHCLGPGDTDLHLSDTQLADSMLELIPHETVDGYVFQIAPPVGGIWVPINKTELLTPWIGLASLLMVFAISASVIYVKCRKEEH